MYHPVQQTQKMYCNDICNIRQLRRDICAVQRLLTVLVGILFLLQSNHLRAHSKLTTATLPSQALWINNTGRPVRNHRSDHRTIFRKCSVREPLTRWIIKPCSTTCHRSEHSANIRGLAASSHSSHGTISQIGPARDHSTRQIVDFRDPKVE